ncbi:HsdM family class I SAM-dependent methyltransferase [Roseibium album]|uniref:site-specific DNA-methyltransferase (adenine-specific) n=1 Tax=Roseibium album TaxID=311410 RepID=A0A0M7B2V9_9HYPH|nr:N-6 DNA methylase [Roseibium album]CTQ63465.1 Type IIS restriction enzyme Eco57I [Roseibium album]CTQ79504.1 Type IIS restriction enzyme Eco57I [Roseibium album]CTQ81052.1 Type IIS restriction enzyme Eco57I [Roseibium album]
MKEDGELTGPWVSELGYDQLPKSYIVAGSASVDLHPFAPELRAIFGPETGAAGNAVFCIDSVPTVCLVDGLRLASDADVRKSEIRNFCERLWNQNLARILLVTSSDRLEVWSVDNPEADPKEYTLEQRQEAERTWSVSGLVGGEALRGRDGWFDPQRRVDKILLDNILVLVGKLTSNGIGAPQARRLIARMIFITYLEDRGIVGTTYRSSRNVRPLFDLVCERDRKGLRKLINALRKDFNGDFLTSTESETGWEQLTDSSFSWLEQFLSRTTLRTGQTSFWRYDFSQIPIELIAGIYETFLSSRNITSEEGAGGGAKRDQGAYYTPRLLADWIVELALDGRDILAEKIFDGACGSGMLLTAAFRRVIRAYEVRAVSSGLEPVADFATRRRLLLDQIYGGDIDEDACQLTAFSLYLALLSDLNPSDLIELRKGGHQLPTLTENIRRGAEGDFFSEESEKRNNERFTVFLSNPPWRKLRAQEPAARTLEDWRSRQSEPRPHIPKRQIATAFALGAADTLAPNGRVALILPVTPFVSGDPTQRDFRVHLLGRYSVEKIINFSDMRRLIFADAVHPFVVLIATARPPSERFGSIEAERFEYWTPKTDISLAFGRLAVHGGDRDTMPSSALITDEAQLATRYWGSNADIDLLKRLIRRGRIRELAKTGWIEAKGFHAKDEDRRRSPESWYIDVPEWMSLAPFLSANMLPRDLPIVPKQSLSSLPFDRIARIPAYHDRLFDGPRVLWTDGTHPIDGVKAIYADQPFSFQHSLAVLAAPNTETGRLLARFLTAYLRSPMGVWLLLLLSGSVASERPKLHIREALDWPFWSLENHPRPDAARSILSEVDQILARVENSHELKQSRAWQQVQPEVNQLVYSYFQLTDNEIAMIEELATFAGPALQPTSLRYGALKRPLRESPTIEMMRRYAGTLAKTLLRWRNATGGQGSIQVATWTGRRVPIGAAVLTLGDQPCADKLDDDSIIEVISQALGNVIGNSEDTLLTVPDVAAIDGNQIYLVKPLIARFWMRRCAIEDGNQLALQLQALSRERMSA